MKTFLLLVLSGGLLLTQPALSSSPGSAFTYQGQLSDAGYPANGRYDLKFTLFGVPEFGLPIGGIITTNDLAISGGLFTAVLDFGAESFNGDPRWLEIAVRTQGAAAFTTLAPRQLLTPTPYALYAPSAGVAATAGSAGTVPWIGLSGVPAGFADAVDDDTTYTPGTGLTLSGASFSLNTDFTDQRYWKLGGNGATTPGTQFLGTTDNKALELKTNARRVLRLEPDPVNDAPNIIAGTSSNRVGSGVVGAVIAGGGRAIQPNRALGDWSAIGGGELNVVSNTCDVVSGGYGNSAGGGWSTVGGGDGNVAYDVVMGRTTVAGGMDNRALGQVATVGGGRDNAATNSYATVPGGRNNLAGGEDSLAMGRRAKAVHDGVFVWGDSTDADFASSAANQFLIRAKGGVGIGTNQPQSALHVAGEVIANGFSGGGAGLIGLSASQITSGILPDARLSANVSRLGGSIEASEITDGTIGANDVQANTFWKCTGNSGTMPGTHLLGTTDNQPLEFRANGARVLRLEPGSSPNVVGGHADNAVSKGAAGATIAGGGEPDNGDSVPDNNRVTDDLGTVGGGSGNQAGDGNADFQSAESATVGGGFRNTAGGRFALVAGGRENTASAYVAAVGGGWKNSANGMSATVGGGESNTASGAHATVGGGFKNAASGNWAAVGGGESNAATDARATVAGGERNKAYGAAATVGGGFENTASTNFATVPGGSANCAGGCWSFAAGRQAKANHNGAFVWADSTDADFASTGSNQFLIRAAGGVGINTSSPGAMLDVALGDAMVRGTGNFTSGTDARLILGDANNYVRALWGEGLRFGVYQGADALAVKNGGTVGIGTTSPEARLHIASGGGQPQLWVQQTSGQEWARLCLGGPTNHWILSVRNEGTPALNFWNGSANVMVLSRDGRLTAKEFIPTSDRNAKEHFAPVDPADVLEKVAALPLATWNFKSDPAARHLGPVSQDFHAAFGLGHDDKHISTLDADGVALAAIQGLNQKVEARSQESRVRMQKIEEALRAKDAEIAELRHTVSDLKAMVGQLLAHPDGGTQ